ncbi:MAG: beta-hydroxyacyl-ACP dehydratase [Sedimentisphaerales bacterium]|nr:beta-hydroxyacyl-ACP dehydratase [Sedimentisphaerales bacterium]
MRPKNPQNHLDVLVVRLYFYVWVKPMPPALLANLDAIDLNKVLYDTATIEKVNPHRFEMRQLDAIVHEDKDVGLCVGYKDITEDEFWVRGHIPGRPLMPGVVMIEAAAQLASFYVLTALEDYASGKFVGFGGIDEVKFRGSVVPGDRLYLIAKLLESRPRRFVAAAQGIVNGQMVLQAKIVGMPM